ncbi:MAG: thioredoxin fold domain-containing protein [Pontiellaceae bacterium]|nr:thioredoxin fold domain-containing protein [Pontiellaceae bacterium]MBN2786397.1 thioredoxin fold domain-containing protein [Pontiellaceae bacterium]
MKRTWGGVLAFLIIVAAGAEARTWTSSDGRTVEADLVRVKDGKVYLDVLPGRKIIPIEISKLSEADQKFIAEYQADQKREAAAAAEQEKWDKRKVKWNDDIKDAMKESKEFNLPIFMLFTAPSWCSYCMKLEDEILKTSEFKDFAKKNLVLLEVDCSTDGVLQKWQKKNTALAEKCPVTGYPTAFLIDVKGEVLGKYGYNSVKPDEYTATIKARMK